MSVVLIVGLVIVLALVAYLLYAVHRLTKALKPPTREPVAEPAPKGPPRFDQYEIKPPDPFPASLGLCMFTAPRMHV